MSELSSGQRLPFPGLRSFRSDETDLFFGRENSVNHMIRRLAASRFLAVLGASGSGKSSLVRTGLLDGLELGLLAQAGSWWRVVDIRPGGEPLRNLARGLCGEAAGEDDVEQMRAFLLRGPRSIVQWAAENLKPGENLLLLVDQFEELFRYQHYEGRQEAEVFVGLLVESARNRDQSVYVTLTMRSEFLGACALFGGLAEAMNDGQYLTPRMTREQCREAIEGPAAVCGFKIEPALVNRMLNDLSDFAPWDDPQQQTPSSQLDRMVRRADQLPLLQHALNRLWIRAAAQPGDILLKLADYDALGGLRGALNQHADEILTELGPAKAPVVEQVFRALTVGTTIADAVRRPTRLRDLVEITGASREDIVAVCDAFRAPGRNFLAPFPPVPLRDETYIDISHESLIRQWSDLSGWLEKEARDAEAMRRLGAASDLSKAGTGDLLRGRELANLDSWRTEAGLAQAWAQRYVDSPREAFDFLDQSVQARRDYEQRIAAEKSGAQRASRLRWASLAGLAIALLTGYILLQRHQVAALSEAQAQIEQQRERAEAAAEEATRQAELALGQQALAEKAAEEAREAKAAAEGSEREARQAREALDAQVSNVVQPYVAGSIDKQQRESELAGSVDLLTALARQLPPENMPEHIVDRLAWQSAAQSASSMADQSRLGGDTSSMNATSGAQEPLPAYALVADSTNDAMLVVEQATGSLVARFDVPDDAVAENRSSLDNFLSPDGKAALLVGKKGRLFRWSTGQERALRVLDTSWLAQANSTESRIVTSVAFDTANGDIAVVFDQYSVPFIAVVPVENADRSMVWPVHRLVESESGAGYPAVVAIADGKPLLSFTDDEGRFLLRYDPATKTAKHIVGPDRLMSAYQTGSGLVRLRYVGQMPDCGWGQNAQSDDSVSCVADYDLGKNEIVIRSPPLPARFAEADVQTTRSVRRLTSSSQDMSDGWAVRGSMSEAPLVLSAKGRPSWAIEPSPHAGNLDIARLTYWRRKSSMLDNFSQVTTTTVSTRDGFAVFGLTGNFIQQEGTLALDRAAGSWGKWMPPREQAIAELKPTPGLAVVDASGTGVAAFSANEVQFHAGGKWQNAVISGPAAACVKRMQPSGVQPERPQQLVDRIVTEVTGQAPTADTSVGYSVVATSISIPRYLLTFSDGAIASLTFSSRQDGKGYEALIECPDVPTGNHVLATDFDGDRIALFNPSGGRLSILRGAVSTQIATLSSEQVRFAVFADDSLVVLTDKDRLLAFDTASGTPADARPGVMANPLPGAEGLYATQGSLALVRTEGASSREDRWLSVAIVAFDGKTRERGRATHLGMLPFGYDAISAAQLLEGGRFDVMTPGHLFRFDLPSVSAIPELVGELQPLADEKGLDSADQSLLGLLASAMGVDGNRQAKTFLSTPYGRCAHALYSWQGGHAEDEYLGADVSEGDTLADDAVLQSCGDVNWPTARAAVELRTGANVKQMWPRAASVLLAQAASGDPHALRSLLGWANRAPSREIKGRGAEFLIDAIYSDFEGPLPKGPAVDFFEAAVRSLDPHAHLAIARFAEKRQDREGRMKALLHYTIAERLLIDNNSVDLSRRVTTRKIAVAHRLSSADRVAVVAQFSAWTPQLPPAAAAEIPTDLKARVSADVVRLGELARAPGTAVGFELLRLHLLLRLHDITTGADNVEVGRQINETLLGRTDWAEVAVDEENELVSAFERMADGVSDEPTAIRLRLAGVRLVEHAGETLTLDNINEENYAGSVYKRLLRKLAEAGQERVAAEAGNFIFGKRAYSFSTVRLDDAARTDAVQAILEDRMALARFLMPRPDAQAAYATTLFWRVVNRYDQVNSNVLKVSDAEKKQLQDALQLMYRQAYQALGALPRSGPDADPDDLAIFVSSVSWALDDRFVLEAPGDTFPVEFEHAREVADYLFALTERGAWSAVWDRQPGETRLGLDDKMASKGQLSLTGESAFGVPDLHAYALRLRTLGFSANIDRIMKRGGVNEDDDGKMLADYSVSAGYALSSISGHVMGPARTATECDRLASHEGDPARRAPGIVYDAAGMARAVEVCEAAVAADATDQTSRYALARSLSDVEGRLGERVDILLKLASENYAIAYNNLMVTAEERDVADAERRALADAYVNRVARDNFAPALEGLLALPASAERDVTLHWIATFAETRGSPEASLYLAGKATDPSEKAYHLQAAASSRRLPVETVGILFKEAAQIMDGLDASERTLIQGRIEAYRPWDLFGDEMSVETRNALRAEPAGN